MTRWVLLVVLALGCGPSAEDPSTVRRDVLALQAVASRDRSPALMIDVERAVSGRKPVHAAAMIQASVMPELNLQIERVRAVDLATVSVRKLQLRLIAALEKRKDGLSTYRSILASGSLDTPEVIGALRTQRDAESELLMLDEDLAKLRPAEGAFDPAN